MKYIYFVISIICGVISFYVLPDFILKSIWGTGFLVASIAFLYVGLKGK